MKGVQYETYQSYIKKRLEDKKKELEKEENGENNEENKSRKIDNILGDKIIQISNIVYPTDTGEATYGKHGFDDKGEGPFNRVNVTQMDKTYTQFKYRKQAILNRGTKQEVPFLDEKVLGDYSAKFARALSFMKKAKGTVLLSSKYIQSGVLPFALMLEQNGFTRYTTEGEKQLLDQKDYPQTRRPRICYKCGEEFKKDQHINKKNKDYHLFKEARYVLVTSKSDNLVKININEAVDKFSATDNRYGEQIKIFLGTDVIKEGLDFVSEKDALLALGIKPSRPETGYGYIQVNGNKNVAENKDIFKVKTFTEKPNKDLAKVFYESGEFFWNAGIFSLRISAFLM